MKYLTAIAGALLGLMFLIAASLYFLGVGPKPNPPAGSATALFLGALVPTGYFTVVKILEIVGGVLVALPPTRRLGLLILGPIIINILLFHLLIAKGEGIANALPVAVLALFLVWAERRAFAAYLRGG